MKIVSFDCPEVNSLTGYMFTGFPNPVNEATKLFRFISENPGCTRDAMYDHFSSIATLMWFRENDLVRCAPYNRGGYELTPGGKEVIKFIDWIEPVYELLEIFAETNPQNFDELDVTATMAGRHDLVEEDIAIKIEMIRRHCNGFPSAGRSYLQGVKVWMSEVFHTIIPEVLTTYTTNVDLITLFKEKYSLDFS